MAVEEGQSERACMHAHASSSTQRPNWDMIAGNLTHTCAHTISAGDDLPSPGDDLSAAAEKLTLEQLEIDRFVGRPPPLSLSHLLCVDWVGVGWMYAQDRAHACGFCKHRSTRACG